MIYIYKYILYFKSSVKMEKSDFYILFLRSSLASKTILASIGQIENRYVTRVYY